jgi:chromate transporter
VNPHNLLERIGHQPCIRSFLDGLTAGVVGLIAGTTITLIRVSVVNWETASVFALALIALIWSKTRLTVPIVIGMAAVYGWISGALI